MKKQRSKIFKKKLKENYKKEIFNDYLFMEDEFPRSIINYNFKENSSGIFIKDLENANLEFEKIEKDVIEFAKILEKGMSKKDLKKDLK